MTDRNFTTHVKKAFNIIFAMMETERASPELWEEFYLKLSHKFTEEAEYWRGEKKKAADE